jgi:uncharacterized protein (TIGR00730 family)
MTSSDLPYGFEQFDFDDTETPSSQSAERRPQTIPEFVRQMKETADKFSRDGASRGDVKMMNVAFKELRYALKVFSAYKDRRKVTVFGSARTKPDDPSYAQAIAFGQRMAEAGYLVITGAGGGIMEGAHIGAGKDHSLGLNIMLPFEQSANAVISTAGDRLVTLKYFFTRKLMFVKEADAVILFPGGFGTQDEGFEVLTLVQTGKSHLFPIVCVDHPQGNYWKRWDEFIRSELLERCLISPDDCSLYRVTNSVDEAVEEVVSFHRVYHSMRYVKGDLILRIQKELPPAFLEELRKEFSKIVVKGTIEQTWADPSESNDEQVKNLPRLRFRFDRRNLGALRRMVDRINREA